MQSAAYVLPDLFEPDASRPVAKRRALEHREGTHMLRFVRGLDVEKSCISGGETFIDHAILPRRPYDGRSTGHHGPRSLCTDQSRDNVTDPIAKPVSPFSGNRTPQARSGCAEEPPAIDRKPELARLFGAAWRCDVGLPHHDPRIVPISCDDHHTARADAHVEGRTTDVDLGLRGGGFAGEERVKPRSPEFCGWWICTKSCPFEASHDVGLSPAPPQGR
jgi:hypothetical protein